MNAFACKTPECGGVAASNFGRYSYCKECQEKRAQPRPEAPAERTFAQIIKEMQAAAKTADRLKARAKKLTGEALRAKAEADQAASKVAELARSLT